MKNVTTATAQGPRDYQEDRYLVHEFHTAQDSKAVLLAVFDGHDGSEVAEFCKTKLGDYFSLNGAGTKQVMTALANAVAKLAKETRHQLSGTTLSAVCVINNTAVVAVVGDSPVIIVGKNRGAVVSPEHNVRTNMRERETAIARGGIYASGYIFSKSNCGLQVSRALGDVRMGDVISHEPEIHSVALGPQSIVLVCTDGMIDPLHENTKKEIKRLLRLAKRGASAMDLLEAIKDKGLRDNATAILWRMENH